ncbi:glycosyl transferase [Sphaerisporangium krabiense]|uniref:Glycosyltransferase involved in cell wall biosynthesis n=1 Tax=Sphaerisporangium krabiense TaxID=763782 RepID=A0A7W9DTF2_9ACTN|nr:glycosyltransferase [Sphaerisporangium krabiense]MBB5630563.1 glycosyltransferase involved in cell wall biosynthesis [Sphaerisporangium krabiense]GII62483.1 glycosyl transferase [Sphaerisporangium krabiense]
MKSDSRIRVMEIIARLNVGGPATQISGLIERLNHREFDHRLYTGHVEEDEADHPGLGVLAGHPDDPALRVHRVHGLGRAIRPSDDVRALAHLVAAMRRFRPHVVHTRTAKAGALGRLASVLSGAGSARVHTFHGHLLDGYFTGAKRAAYVRAERALATVSHRLVTVGDRVREDLLAAGIGRPGQYVVIPPGVGLRPPPSRETARKDLDLPMDAPVVAFLGRLTKVKRPDRLLATAEAVLGWVPGCRFVVCGGGELREETERAAARLPGPVVFTGWRGDTETVYAAADVVLLTSDNEGTPLTLIEAGMAGVPVVATRVGSVGEVVLDGRTGLLAGRDPAELAGHVVRLLTDPGLARTMGEAARRWTTSSYAVERLVSDTEALYRALHRAAARDRRPQTTEVDR